ncbi:MAG: methyltransferase domain-containing protein, partial [Dehalococcoidales bacterium]|nr:methyltransferase domain-containing protein [Dehalococcoidales bacterium]
MKKDAVKNIWNANAEFWDKRMGEGNDFHRFMIEPNQLKLLNIKPGQQILDIACGNGQFARKMTEMGAKVTAVDFADKFIEIARAKSPKTIDFHVADATKTGDLKKLGVKKYDAVVSTMALMDMEKIEILIGYIPRLLKKNGVFVFSITHPCFNSGENVLTHERDDIGGSIKDRYAVKVSNYMVEKSYLGVGMSGQPEQQYYFHRPISTILE